MTIFNALFVLNLALVIVALVRQRPATLVIAANQAETLRALDNIQAFGQPSSEAMLPSWIFSQHNLDVAWKIFAICTVLLATSLLLTPRQKQEVKADFQPLPKWAAVLVGIYLVLLTVSSGSVWSHSYYNEGGSIFGVSLGGLNAFVFSLLLYEVVRRAQLGIWRPLPAFLVIAGVMFAACYSKGSTGLATGYGICAGVMIWPPSNRSVARRTLVSIAMVSGIVVMAFVVRGVRTLFYEQGTASVIRLFERSDERELNRSLQGEGIESAGNGTQYACHVLECTQLYESGISRHWVSMVNPLIYTFEPSFIMDAFGWTRPLDAPWELGRYYNHGGGIYLPGELYWNGGYFCVLVVFGLVILLALFCDTRYRRNAFWLMICAQFAPNLFMGIGYGAAQTSRGLFNGLLAIGLYLLIPTFRLRSKFNSPAALSRRRVPVVRGT